MRAFVIALAILAGVKIWTQQSLFRAASEQALLKAYGIEAVASCEKAGRRGADLIPNLRKSVDWSQARTAKVVIGDNTVDVALWQVDHKNWDRRFKTPYIHLRTNKENKPLLCVFDIMMGTASVNRV